MVPKTLVINLKIQLMSANGHEYEMRGKCNQTTVTELFSLVYGVTQTAD